MTDELIIPDKVVKLSMALETVGLELIIQTLDDKADYHFCIGDLLISIDADAAILSVEKVSTDACAEEAQSNQ